MPNIRSIKSNLGKIAARVGSYIVNGPAPRKTVITMAIGSGNGFAQSHATYGSGAKFPAGLSASRLVNIHDHFRLRQNVRDAMYDSSVARGIVERFTDTVVDTGLKLKPTPVADVIGMTLEEAETWADNVAQRFHLWASSKKSARNRQNNFYQNQHLYEFFQQRDNDVFVRFYYGRDKDQFNPLQIEFIDPNQIRGYDYTTTYMQYGCDDGIIRDSNGREVGYKVWNTDPATGKMTDSTIPARGEKSGRIFMIHGHTIEYAGQGRGYPRLSHALHEFEEITNFKQATIQKAIIQASYVMAVENPQKDPSNPMQGRAAGPPEMTYGTGAEDILTTEATVDTEPRVNYEAHPEATMTAPGVGIFNLREGDQLKYLQDTSPSAQYEAFVNAFCSYLCASVNMPVEMLLMKFSQNYSASRATMILFWRVAQYWRNEMSSDFLDPTYECWLSEEIASGNISAPGWSDPLLRAAWLCCEWAGLPMPNIDPLKSIQASKMAVELSAETLDDISRDYNGSSGKSNRAKLNRQYAELPQPPWGWGNKQNSDNVNKEDKQDE